MSTSLFSSLHTQHCFRAISDLEIRDSFSPLTAVSGPVEGAPHSSQPVTHKVHFIICSSKCLDNLKSGPSYISSYFSLFVMFLLE